MISNRINLDCAAEILGAGQTSDGVHDMEEGGVSF